MKGFDTMVDESTILEMIENRKNPINWIKNNLKIPHPAHGSIPFNLYPFQEKIVNLFLAKHFIITLKSRQIGMSTLVQSICLWAALHYANYNVLIISAGQRNACSFLAKIKGMYDSIPESKLKLKLVTDNKQTLEFSNGSKIVALPATRSASLGESINLLVIDEAAFIPNVDGVYQACYPTLSRAFNSAKGKPYGIIVISTPNGISGDGKWYYQLYEGSIRGDNKYVPVKVHWSAVPEYNEKWYLDQCSQLNWDYRAIAAELELSFVSSGNTYIPGPILDSIQTTDPISKSLDDKLWIWENPIPGQTYVAGVDVAYGDKKDYSTIQILKASTLEQVAEYESNVVKVDDFAGIIISLTKYYNGALVNIERNAVGKVLIEKILNKTGYGIGINLFRNVSKNEIETRFNKDAFKATIGTDVTSQSRDVILANMYDIIINRYTEALESIVSEEEALLNAKARFEAVMSGKSKQQDKKLGIIRSERLLYQLLRFVVDDSGRPEGHPDDLIFAWTHALYCWVKSKAFLLKDVAKILSNTVGLYDASNVNIDTLKFMRNNSDSKIWKNLSVEELQTILDEENEEKDKINSENNEIKEESSIMKVWKAFI